jgi:hypothetical protein
VHGTAIGVVFVGPAPAIALQPVRGPNRLDRSNSQTNMSMPFPNHVIARIETNKARPIPNAANFPNLSSTARDVSAAVPSLLSAVSRLRCAPRRAARDCPPRAHAAPRVVCVARAGGACRPRGLGRCRGLQAQGGQRGCRRAGRVPAPGVQKRRAEKIDGSAGRVLSVNMSYGCRSSCPFRSAYPMLEYLLSVHISNVAQNSIQCKYARVI